MGRLAVFDFRLSLVPGANGARLDVTRVSGGARDVRDPVRIVFRPDLEWRSFHATTKAQGAVEQAFGAPGAVRATADGFTFQPYGEDRLVFTVEGGAFHEEPAWTYCVGHPEEAERGQDPCGDLFSALPRDRGRAGARPSRDRGRAAARPSRIARCRRPYPRA